MYAIIIPFTRSFDDVWLTYIIPQKLEDKIQIGQIVLIPFKTSTDLWLVYKIENTPTEDIIESKLKEIIEKKNGENSSLHFYFILFIRSIFKIFKFRIKFYYAIFLSGFSIALKLTCV